MAFVPVIVATALLCILLQLLRGQLIGGRKSTLPLPPGPRGLPVLGALPFIGPAPHSSLARLAKRYGGIMYLKMGTCGVVVASSPSAARSFLTNLDEQFANRPDAASIKDITYNRQTIVFSDYTPLWKLLRKLLHVHMLGPRAMAEWAYVRRNESGHVLRSLLEKSRQGKPVVIPETLVCAVANIIGQVVLSRRVFEAQGEESNEFKDMIVELLTMTGLFSIGDVVPAIAWMDLQGVQGKMRRLHRKLDALVTKMLEEHAARAHEREGKPDLIDPVTANRVGDDGVMISDVSIKGLILDLLIAGADTSSIVTEWALAEMIKNPSILQRAQQEMDVLIGRDRRLEESDIPKLPYLQAVVKETFRLHPSTPLSLPHYSFKACEVDGYYIPENTRLLVNVYAIGRDPDVWEDPLRFDPERFLSGEGARIEPMGTDFELIPFGAGRRICAGKQAGLVFVQYFLGTLVHAFDWAMPGAKEMNMDEAPGAALPKAVPVSALVTPRLAPSAYA